MNTATHRKKIEIKKLTKVLNVISGVEKGSEADRYNFYINSINNLSNRELYVY